MSLTDFSNLINVDVEVSFVTYIDRQFVPHSRGRHLEGAITNFFFGLIGNISKRSPLLDCRLYLEFSFQ